MGIRDDPTCSSCEEGPKTNSDPFHMGMQQMCCALTLDSGENFITLYILISAEPCEIHSKITGVLMTYRSPVHH